jgi:SAM-dependent methyltransferase
MTIDVEEYLLYRAFYDGDPSPIVDFILRWVGEGPIRILEVGCGPGRLLPPLKALGWDVVAMDPNSSFSRAAAETGAEVRTAGFCDIEDVDEFEVIISVNDPLQYLLSLDERADAISRLHRALRPDGLLLLDVSNFFWILKNYRSPRDIRIEYQGIEIKCTTRYEIDFHNAIWTHIDNYDLTHPDGSKSTFEQIHRLSMMGYPELEWLLKKNRFVEIQTWPDFRSESPGPLNGPRIIVTCRKSG